jgi:hypothetical protein
VGSRATLFAGCVRFLKKSGEFQLAQWGAVPDGFLLADGCIDLAKNIDACDSRRAGSSGASRPSQPKGTSTPWAEQGAFCENYPSVEPCKKFETCSTAMELDGRTTGSKGRSGAVRTDHYEMGMILTIFTLCGPPSDKRKMASRRQTHAPQR